MNFPSPRTAVRAGPLLACLALACGRDDGPRPEKLAVPDYPLFVPDKPPPPPPPPPPPGPVPPPAELVDFLRSHDTRREPWQVTLVDVASGKHAALADADAAELVTRLGRRDAWMAGVNGCGSSGTDVRVQRGPGPPLVFWTSCGNVRLDHTEASLAGPTYEWLRDHAAAVGITAP